MNFLDAISGEREKARNRRLDIIDDMLAEGKKRKDIVKLFGRTGKLCYAEWVALRGSGSLVAEDPDGDLEDTDVLPPNKESNPSMQFDLW